LTEQKTIPVGKISGAFGIKGWIKIFSYTDPRENILNYSPWILQKGNITKQVEVIDGNLQGQAVVARVLGVNDRDKAEAIIGWDILITAEQLPVPAEDEYYWSDLIGLTVETLDHVVLGVVDSLMETGANDVVIVQGERQHVIPFLQGHTIHSIDLVAGKIIVDWDPDF